MAERFREWWKENVDGPLAETIARRSGRAPVSTPEDPAVIQRVTGWRERPSHPVDTLTALEGG